MLAPEKYSGEQGKSNLGSFMNISVKQDVIVMYHVYYGRGSMQFMHILGEANLDNMHLS